MVETTLPIFVLRVLSPALVFITALSLLPLKQAPQPGPSAITSVVVANSIPRRSAILAFLSLTAVSYLGDGLVFVVYAVISKNWPRHTALPLNAVLGLVSFSGIAAIGAWKDVAGANVWSLKRLKLAVFASLSLDIALLAFLALEIHLQLYRESCSSRKFQTRCDPFRSSTHSRGPHSAANFASSRLPDLPSSLPDPLVWSTAHSARGVHPCGILRRRCVHSAAHCIVLPAPSGSHPAQ